MSPITDKTRDEVAEVSLRLILRTLKQRANEEVIERLCKERCKSVPEGHFCRFAKRTRKYLMAQLLRDYVDLN